MVNFELTRSRFRDITGTTLWEGARVNQPYHFGLQLAELTKRLEESSTGMTSGRHYVGFSFSVSANIFSRQYSDRVEATAQVSTLFTLLLSVLAFFRFAKTQAENLTDTAIMYLAEKKRFPVPKDVQHRVRVLEERLKDPLDSGAVRSEQDGGATAAAAAAGGAHGSQRRQSRRLSMMLSREADVAAEAGDIEMVSVPNPMARHGNRLDDGGAERGKTLLTHETIELLQTEVGLLNAKLAQQQSEMAQQRQQNEEQRQQLEQRVEQERQQLEQRVEQQRQQLEQRVEQQRIQIDRLMAIVESTTFSTAGRAGEDNTSHLPEGWTALKSEEGETYYQKPDGSVTWDLP